MIGDVRALAANIAFTHGAILVPASLDKAVALNLDLQAAAISAQYTTRLLP